MAEEDVRKSLAAAQDTAPPKLHPTIESDQYMSVSVSRHPARGKYGAIIKCPRGLAPCGVCAGNDVRCIFYEEDSGNAWTNFFMEFRCLDCGNYTTWDYND